MPLWPAALSVIVKSTMASASGPLVIQFFEPLMTYSSPLRTATVFCAAASLPASGSVRPKQPSFSPRAKGARNSLLLLVGAELQHRVAVERVVHAHDDAGGGAAAADLLHGQRVADVVQPGAAVLLGHRHAQQRQLGELLHRLVRARVVPRPTCGRWG